MLVGGGIVYLLTMSMFTDMLGLSFTLPAAAGTVAAVLAVIGLIGIVLTSGRESRSWFKRILKGLYGAYGVTSYLSDIPVSYTHLDVYKRQPYGGRPGVWTGFLGPAWGRGVYDRFRPYLKGTGI